MGDTRAALIEAAIAALHESGFARASARRTAQRAGCNQALVFYHFGSVTTCSWPRSTRSARCGWPRTVNCSSGPGRWRS